MKILYVTRHFNHSGFKILNALIKNKANIVAVVLKTEFIWRSIPLFRNVARILYLMECRYYRCRPLKNMHSEELLARKAGLPIIKCKTMKSETFLKKIMQLGPDLILLGGGWHELVPANVFSYPPLGCINTHPSLLPLFRGTSITRWQILHGVEESGSTIHFVDESFDTGKIIAKAAMKVHNDETPQGLFEKLGDLGAQQMPQVLQQFAKKSARSEFMGSTQSFVYEYYPKWKWEEGSLLIDWRKPLKEIHNFIRANTQESFRYLGPYFFSSGKRYFLRESSLQPVSESLLNKGLTVVTQPNGYFLVSRTGETVSLVMKSIQRYDRYFEFHRSYRPGRLINPARISFTGDP